MKMVFGREVEIVESPSKAMATTIVVSSEEHLPSGVEKPEDVPYSFKTNKGQLISAWIKAVEQFPKDAEVIWTAGYRGLNDRPFWEDDANSPSSKQEQADLILAAIKAQMKIVKDRFDDPYFIMNTWGEGSDFIREGYLKVPEEIHLVWADDGTGIILDKGDIKAGEGAYYHTAMFNSRGNQLSEMIPLERLQGELTRMINAGATEYLLVNCSDLRPVVMGTKATMEIAYDAEAWLENPDRHEVYLQKSCADNFGEENAEAIAKIFDRYYEAPAQFGTEFYELASDVFYHRYGRQFLRRMVSEGEETFIKPINDMTDAEPIARRLTKVMGEATPRWEKLWADAKAIQESIPENRRNFYQANVIVPISVHLHSNNILYNITKAFLSDSKEKRIELLSTSITEGDAMTAALDKAEYGKWKDFYLNDLMTALPTTKKSLEIALKEIKGEPNYESIDDYIGTWDMWKMMKTYQGPQKSPI